MGANVYSRASAEALRSPEPERLASPASGPRWWRRPVHGRVRQLIDGVNRHPGLFLVCFSTLFLAGAVARALLKPLWFDEILALRVASQTTLGGIWSALLSGVDLHPPLHHVFSHWLFAITGAGSLALRIPALVGFCVMELCLFRFVARRTNAVYGAVVLAIPVSTRVVEYSIEGRPYGLMLGFAALALLTWQASTDDRPRRGYWLCGLALSLAGAISTSYHAALIFPPFALAEAARTWTRRRIDWPVWIAIGVGALPLLLFYPTLMAAPLSYLATIPHRPGLDKLIDSYAVVLMPTTIPAVAAAIALACYPRGPVDRAPASSGFRPHEVVVMLGFVLIPFFSFILALVRTGTFLWVYVIPIVIGLALLGAMTIFYSSRRSNVHAVIIAAVFLAWFAVRQVVPIYSALGDPQPPSSGPALLLNSALDSAPVVIADPIIFLRLVEEPPPDSPTQLYYLTGLHHAQRFTGQDSAERSLLDLHSLEPIAIRPYEDFTQQHRQFYVYSTGKRWEWVISKLLEDGARVEVVQKGSDEMLLRVTLPGFE